MEKRDGSSLYYASSFVGYFPADKPKYSCIVMVHEPSTVNNNYYGADVAGPVFKG
jgi:cell division protein FtsI (penicillin-binding protein 3)